MQIKMRVAKDKDAECCSCGNDRANSLEMYEMMIGKNLIVVCDRCMDEILRKCCRASVQYSERPKDNKEINRINAIKAKRLGGK